MQPDQLGGHIVDQVHLSGYELQKPPHRFEAGTPPIEGVLGWGAGVDYLEDLGMEQVALHQQDLVRYAHERLQRIPHVRIVGPSDPAHRQALLSFNVDGLEAHGVARMLSQRFNVYVRSGFHCAQPLHEMLRLRPTVRASFQIYNEREDVDLLAQCLESITSLI